MPFKARLTKCQTKEQTELSHNYVKHKIQIRTALQFYSRTVEPLTIVTHFIIIIKNDGEVN